MKAIIVIAALAMAFASVSAQEVRGGPLVSLCLIFLSIPPSLSPNQMNSNFISITYFFLSLGFELAVVGHCQ
jgi:hypothetical protein